MLRVWHRHLAFLLSRWYIRSRKISCPLRLGAPAASVSPTTGFPAAAPRYCCQPAPGVRFPAHRAEANYNKSTLVNIGAPAPPSIGEQLQKGERPMAAKDYKPMLRFP